MGKSALFLIFAFAATAAMAQPVKTEMECRFTGTDFVYDCIIRLSPPNPAIQVTVGADMPSMPMAHNIKPVKAQPGAAPGEYRARLDLEMTGEWAVKLRLSGAVRDQRVLHYEFDETGARPIRRASRK